MGEPPPDDRDRVRLFVGSVEMYESFSRTMPLPEHLVIAPTYEMDSDYWSTIMHGVMLRKYVSPKDHLFLSKVIRSMAASCDSSNSQITAKWTAMGRAFKKVQKPQPFEYSRMGETIPISRLAFDELYGSVLHGEWNRWKNNQIFGDVSRMALYLWVEEIRAAIMLARHQWNLAVEEGAALILEPLSVADILGGSPVAP
jgi:hypothetical protein